MPECNNCGEHVTDKFVRVFGDENNVVHSCQECGELYTNRRERADL